MSNKTVRSTGNGATFTTSYRGDIRKIATIAKWMIDEGKIAPRSRNEVINTCVDNFHNFVCQTFPGCKIDKTELAFQFLDELGLIGKNLKKMQGGLSAAFWKENVQTAPTTSVDEEITVEAFKGQSKDIMKLVQERVKKNQQDSVEMKQLGDVSHLPIQGDDEE